MMGELPALIATGYADIEEEDLVRLKWWGLYHDKPKIGTFMLRIKLPAGRIDARAVARGGRALERVRARRRRADDPPDDPAPLPGARLAAEGVRSTARGRVDDSRRLRGRGQESDRVPGRRTGPRRALRRHRAPGRGGRVLLRQSGLLRPAAQAQDLDLGVRAPLQCAGDQLHLARRGATRRRAWVRSARRRWAVVGAAHRARPRGLDPRRRGDARDPRVARRVAGGPALPGLAREGADEVHGRRSRPRGDARGGRAAPRLRAPRLHPRAARPRAGRSHGRRSRSTSPARARSGRPCTWA